MPADPEALLNDEVLITPHGEMPWQPYWAQAWEASMGLCEHLVTLPLAGQVVLDLGCGIGLTSALLAAQGATLTCGDNAIPSLVFAEINTWPWRDNVQVALIDWHKTNLSQRFDWIVGSDIVYDRKEVPPLDRFFRAHLAEQGRVLLSDPCRAMTREFLNLFSELGWQVDIEFMDNPHAKNRTRLASLTLA